MIFNKLSIEDKIMIQDYLDEYGETVERDSVQWYRRASLNDILHYWEDAKNEHLWQMFGEEFILRKQISVKMPTSVLKEEIQDLISTTRGTWYHKFLDIPGIWLYQSEGYNPWRPSLYSYLASMLWADALLANKYLSSTFTLSDPNDPSRKHLVISANCKVMKAIAKILTYVYGETFDFDDFRIKHSQVLNQKELHGTLCLSIHPMDYMTMSDNASGWCSCMAWMPEDGDPDPGCYRRGTVEMMNSQYVVVAYLEGADKMELNDLAHPTVWNNKKWRTLAIVSPEIITTVKSYPYQSAELSVEIVQWLRELAQTNLGWTYENDEVVKYEYNGGRGITELGLEHGNIWFRTCTMYSDFGAVPHYGIISKDAYNITLMYSGPSTCMLCGAKNTDFGDNDMVYCCECCATYYCSCCESHYDRDDMTFFNGSYLCYDCYEEETSTDIITNEQYWNDDFHRLYLLPMEVAKNVSSLTNVDWAKHWYITTCINETQYSNAWKEYFTDQPIYFCQDWNAHYYITVDKLTPMGLELFQDEGDYNWAYSSSEFDKIYGLEREEIDND